MKARQEGVAKEIAMKLADDSHIIADLIEMAYQVPISASTEEQQAIASEFEQDLYQKCLNGAPFK